MQTPSMRASGECRTLSLCLPLDFRRRPVPGTDNPTCGMQAVIMRRTGCHSERSEESHKIVLGMPYEILHSAALRSE